MTGNTGLLAIEVRKFSRFYTNIIGLINGTILESPYSLAEARILLEMLMAGQCTASDLNRILGIDPGYLSRILRRFQREHLIAQKKAATDGRAKVLTLTDKGREIITKLSDASTQQIVKILEKVPGSQQVGLVRHMQAIENILSRQTDKAIAIRDWRMGDAGYIAYRHGVLYEKEYGLDKIFEQYVIAGISKFMENPLAGNIWVAECDGQIVGSIAIVGTDKETAQLRWFLIEPEFRGSGVGRRLMTTAMAYCRDKNFKRVFLWTFQGLDAARHLYKIFGFRPTEQVENNTWKDKLVEERWDIILNS